MTKMLIEVTPALIEAGKSAEARQIRQEGKLPTNILWRDIDNAVCFNRNDTVMNDVAES
jgi:hypothetical protein